MLVGNYLKIQLVVLSVHPSDVSVFVKRQKTGSIHKQLNHKNKGKNNEKPMDKVNGKSTK